MKQQPYLCASLMQKPLFAAFGTSVPSWEEGMQKWEEKGSDRWRQNALSPLAARRAVGLQTSERFIGASTSWDVQDCDSMHNPRYESAQRI